MCVEEGLFIVACCGVQLPVRCGRVRSGCVRSRHVATCISHLQVWKQKQGVMTLIPKDDSDHITRFRPIALLNVDYKILSRILGKRTNVILQSLIPEEQRGFIPGRRIEENIYGMHMVVDWIHRRKLNTMLVQVDFKQAFSAVRWGYLLTALRKMGLPLPAIVNGSGFYIKVFKCVL